MSSRRASSQPDDELRIYEEASRWYASKHPTFDSRAYDEEIVSFPRSLFDRDHVINPLRNLFDNGSMGYQLVSTAMSRAPRRGEPLQWTPHLVLNMTRLIRHTLQSTYPFFCDFANRHFYNHLAYSIYTCCCIWHSFSWISQKRHSPPECTEACCQYIQTYIATFASAQNESFLALLLATENSGRYVHDEFPPPNNGYVYGHFDTFDQYSEHKQEFLHEMNSHLQLIQPADDEAHDNHTSEIWNQHYIWAVFDKVYAQTQTRSEFIKIGKCLAMHGFEQWLRLLNLDTQPKRDLLKPRRYGRSVFQIAKMLGALYSELIVVCGIRCICEGILQGFINPRDNVTAGLQHAISMYFQHLIFEELEREATVHESSERRRYSRPEWNRRLEAMMMMTNQRLMRNSTFSGGSVVPPDIVALIAQFHGNQTYAAHSL